MYQRWVIIIQTITLHLCFGTRGTSGSATERVRINSTGNVGIGTTSPLGILDVQGDSGFY